MSKSKQLREAETRLADREAQRAELVKAIAEAEAKRTPLAKAFERIKARLSRTRIVSNTGGQVWLGSLAGVTVSPYGLRSIVAKPRLKGVPLAKELTEALEAGGLKVNAQGGVELTLRGLNGRIRVPNKARIAAWQRAVKSRQLADKKAAAARNAEDAARQSIFDTGTKVPQETILNTLVSTALAFAKLEAQPAAHELRQKLGQMTGWESAPIEVAKAHLAFAQSPSTEPCPCGECARDRQEAIRRRELIQSIAAMPRRRAECPDHGRKLMGATTAVRELLKLDGPESGRWYEDVPVLWCPVGPHRLFDVPSLRKTLAKAAAKAKAPKVVRFICPSGDGPQESEIQADVDDGSKWVECPRCEGAFELALVKLVAKAA